MVTDIAVVDASLAVKWVLTEPYTSEAIALHDEWDRGGVRLLVPPLLTYEATNVVHQRVRRRQFTDAQAHRALAALISLVGPYVRYVLGLETRALEFARHFSLSATYDSQYLALAESADCEFWTADERLWNAVSGALSWVHWIGGAAPPIIALSTGSLALRNQYLRAVAYLLRAICTTRPVLADS
ncbi:MAG: type II toxin-antitoxin system VapC family toxin [Dehalococcoidia bacterium]